ncbi:MAG: hypothetical protein ACI95C_001796 [Pseudohongiellaceae bacterium]|jgi:hypothetical protein
MVVGYSPWRLITLGMAVSILSACSLSSIEDWPDDLPAVDHFVTVYEADLVNQQYQELNVYLYWVAAFYQGNLAYPTGWRDVEEIILGQTGEHIDPNFSSELYSLGIAIGSEWAKGNPIRKIDNRMLSMWASILQIALASDLHREAVFQVSRDIEGLFAEQLQSQDLVDARYEELLGLELFGSF